VFPTSQRLAANAVAGWSLKRIATMCYSQSDEQQRSNIAVNRNCIPAIQ
jgi:hypothetical protein